jgi:PleD family two-component response regulator
MFLLGHLFEKTKLRSKLKAANKSAHRHFCASAKRGVAQRVQKAHDFQTPACMARILIVDDNKPFRQALAESVRDFGHDAIEASDPLEAFKLIEDADVAFLDLKMPNMSRIEFLREAKPAVPVINLNFRA